MVMHWDAFLAQVRERGRYADPKHAEQAVRVVLGLLGAHLVGADRTGLAGQLPESCAALLLEPVPGAEPLGAEQFVVAAAPWIDGATEQSAHRDVGAVLSVVADTADADLLRRVLLQLPPGYDLLFARPEWL